MNDNIKLYGDGIHDDTIAIQAMLDQGGTVQIPVGENVRAENLQFKNINNIFWGEQFTSIENNSEYASCHFDL